MVANGKTKVKVVDLGRKKVVARPDVGLPARGGRADARRAARIRGRERLDRRAAERDRPRQHARSSRQIAGAGRRARRRARARRLARLRDLGRPAGARSRSSTSRPARSSREIATSEAPGRDRAVARRRARLRRSAARASSRSSTCVALRDREDDAGRAQPVRAWRSHPSAPACTSPTPAAARVSVIDAAPLRVARTIRLRPPGRRASRVSPNGAARGGRPGPALAQGDRDQHRAAASAIAAHLGRQGPVVRRLLPHRRAHLRRQRGHRHDHVRERLQLPAPARASVKVGRRIIGDGRAVGLLADDRHARARTSLKGDRGPDLIRGLGGDDTPERLPRQRRRRGRRRQRHRSAAGSATTSSTAGPATTSCSAASAATA